MEARLLSAGIRVTAEKLGFTQEQIKNYGTTSVNIVFSKLSTFSDVLKNIAEICLNKLLLEKVEITA